MITQNSKMQVMTCKNHFWTSVFISHRVSASENADYSPRGSQGSFGCHQPGTQHLKSLVSFEKPHYLLFCLSIGKEQTFK